MKDNIFDISFRLKMDENPFEHNDYGDEPTLREIIDYYYLTNEFSHEEAEKLTNGYINEFKITYVDNNQ